MHPLENVDVTFKYYNNQIL
uniref:Uncharacterized protein n=1 Tax=Anguilla anguilla TaxID=7936 RepID=A0A0E9VPQ3_ANGAN